MNLPRCFRCNDWNKHERIQFNSREYCGLIISKTIFKFQRNLNKAGERGKEEEAEGQGKGERRGREEREFFYFSFSVMGVGRKEKEKAEAAYFTAPSRILMAN